MGGGAARTLGYYEPGDGGGAIYNIVEDNTLINDGGSVHNLNNGLKAKLIIENEVNIKQFGAKTGTTDCSTEIQKCIDFVQESFKIGKGYIINIPEGKYTVAQELKLNFYTRLKTLGFVLFVIPATVTNIIVFNIQEVPTLDLDTIKGYYQSGWFNAPIIDGTHGGFYLMGNTNKATGNLIGIQFGEHKEVISDSYKQLHNTGLKNIGIEGFTVGMKIYPNNIYCNTFENIEFRNNGIGIQYGEPNTTSINSGEKILFKDGIFGNVAEAVCLYNSVPLKFINYSFDMGGSILVNYGNKSRLELYNCWMERNALINAKYNYSTYFPNLVKGIFINENNTDNYSSIYLDNCFMTYGDEASELIDDYLIRGKFELFLNNLYIDTDYRWGLSDGGRQTKGQLFFCDDEVIIHNQFGYRGFPKFSPNTSYNYNAQFENLEVGEINFSGVNTEIGEYIVYECYNPERIAKVEITTEDTLTDNGKSLKVTAGSPLTCAFRIMHKDYQKIPDNVKLMWADIYSKRDISGGNKATYVNAKVDFFDNNYNKIAENVQINGYEYNAQSSFLISNNNQWVRNCCSNGYVLPKNARYYKIKYNINLLPTNNAIVEVGDYGYISGLFVDFAY